MFMSLIYRSSVQGLLPIVPHVLYIPCKNTSYVLALSHSFRCTEHTIQVPPKCMDSIRMCSTSCAPGSSPIVPHAQYMLHRYRRYVLDLMHNCTVYWLVAICPCMYSRYPS